jgi:hypothetical protein
VLRRAPTPARGKGLSSARIAPAIRAAGRQRNVETRCHAIREQLRSAQLEAPPTVAKGFGASVTALVGGLVAMNAQVAALEEELSTSFEAHSDAEIIRSLPGLGVVFNFNAGWHWREAPLV